MKAFPPRPWYQTPRFKLFTFGVTESGRAWIAFLLVGLVLMTLVVAFAYSISPSRVPFPPP